MFHKFPSLKLLRLRSNKSRRYPIFARLLTSQKAKISTLLLTLLIGLHTVLLHCCHKFAGKAKPTTKILGT
ncbi:hypothetical protein BDV33DRAFT_185679 [Aspergillus novoparasiticus]|uniref:Uncharacterized protein n=1 Tax=Aspergillus novoparasiticus TaxID=986946 RepID=A0A5N6E606_9EURO|nr:hypothetical protein BDV33DRAFT_185679 [Aspergillus novoparasiticus]